MKATYGDARYVIEHLFQLIFVQASVLKHRQKNSRQLNPPQNESIMKACTGKVTQMQNYRLSPKAVAKQKTDAIADLKELSPREWELAKYALRFCPVPNLIERIDASAARRTLKQINDIT